MPRSTKAFSITPTQRAELKRWRRVRNTPHSLALRAQLILLLADGVAPIDIMAKLDVTRPTVFKWRKRFEQDGVEGLRDRARPGQPRKLTQKQIERVLQLTVERIPREANVVPAPHRACAGRGSPRPSNPPGDRDRRNPARALAMWAGRCDVADSRLTPAHRHAHEGSRCTSSSTIKFRT